PRDTNQVFGLFTESSPASILLDAVAQLEAQSPKADDFIQLIRPNLTEAVDTCVSPGTPLPPTPKQQVFQSCPLNLMDWKINAAGREFSIHWQKQLLKAASFGKSVLDLYNSDDFVD